MSFIRFPFFSPITKLSCDECNLGLYPRYIYIYIYISQKTPVKSTVAESTIAGRVSAAVERPRTRLPTVFAFLQDKSLAAVSQVSNPAYTFDDSARRFKFLSSKIEIFRHVCVEIDNSLISSCRQVHLHKSHRVEIVSRKTHIKTQVIFFDQSV